MSNVGNSVSKDFSDALQAGLSSREAEVFVLISQGRGNAEIAMKLEIEYSTACKHVQNIYKKLNVSNRIEAINSVRTPQDLP